MRRRRPNAGSSSFDLFLDTISNTFGGIIFIAILLSLMIQTRSAIRQGDENQADLVSEDRYSELQRELDLITAELDLALARLDSSQTEEAGLDLGDLPELARQRDELNDQRDRLANRLAVQAETVRLRQRELSSLREKISQTPSPPLDLLRSQIASLEEEVKQKQLDQQKFVSVPRERMTTGREQYVILIQGGKHFVAGAAGDDFDFPEGTRNKQVSVSPRLGLRPSVTINPITRNGRSLKATDGQRAIVDLLDQLIQSGDMPFIMIWPDSYSYFSAIEEYCIMKDLPYQLIPMDTSESANLVRGGSAFSQ